MAKKAAITKQESSFLALVPSDERSNLGEIFSEIAGPSGMRLTDLDRIKWPTGGSGIFALPGLDEGDFEPVKELECIVLATRGIRAYWSEPYSGERVPPDCASDDTITGIGDPGGQCKLCPFDAFGTAIDDKGKKRKGKACNERTLALVLLADRFMPSILSIPTTSINEARRFLLRIPNIAGRKPSEVVCGISTKLDKSSDGFEYSLFRGRVIRKLADHERAEVATYQKMILPVFHRIRAAEAAGQPIED